jgi:hypothetical protein
MFIEAVHPTHLKLRSSEISWLREEHCAPSELKCLFGFFSYKHFVPPGLKKQPLKRLYYGSFRNTH